jgi:lipoate-protein ligase A
MRLLDLTLPTAAENLALDEALLVAAEAGTGRVVLRFWENPQVAVVLGAGGSVAHDVNGTACEAAAVPILRRASGGGTVLVGPGCLCFALVLSYDHAPGLHDIRAANRYVLDRVRAALPVPATIEGTSDLALGGMKFSGNAQQRKRTHFLHHGTLLYDFDLTRLSRYLRAPERQPDYRRNRPHAEFVMNLPLSVAELKHRLMVAWAAENTDEPLPWETVRLLLAEKYSRPDWHQRR